MWRKDMRARRAVALLALAVLSLYSSLRQYPREWGLEPASSVPTGLVISCEMNPVSLPLDDLPSGMLIVVNEQGEILGFYRLNREEFRQMDLASAR